MLFRPVIIIIQGFSLDPNKIPTLDPVFATKKYINYNIFDI
jgi:hypothetical protein